MSELEREGETRRNTNNNGLAVGLAAAGIGLVAGAGIAGIAYAVQQRQKSNSTVASSIVNQNMSPNSVNKNCTCQSVPQVASQKKKNKSGGTAVTTPSNTTTSAKKSHPSPQPQQPNEKGKNIPTVAPGQNGGNGKGNKGASPSATTSQNGVKKNQPPSSTPKNNAGNSKNTSVQVPNGNENKAPPDVAAGNAGRGKNASEPRPKNNKYEAPSVEIPKAPSSRRFSTSSSCSSTTSETKQIIIAIDATPSYAGGFLLLPKSNKPIHYYSINWSQLFLFNKSLEAPDVVNAYLALEIFGHYIRDFRKDKFGSWQILVKTPSKFCLPVNGENKCDPRHKSLFEKVNSKLDSLNGRWEYVKPTPVDNYVKIAEKLRQGSSNVSVAGILPEISSQIKPINISKSDFAALHALAIVIPEQLKVA